MANSHVSYLQTLPKDEAIVFVASLQKVKEHLSHELHWMNEQVQQKTVQLQGIDTLLSEAVGLGLASSQPTSTPELTASASETSAPSVTEAVLASVQAAALPDQATLAVANGNNLAATSVAPTNASTASAPPKRGKQRQPAKPTSKTVSKSKRDVKPTAEKPSTSTAKQPSQTKSPGSDENRASLSGFQQFLQTHFQDKSMTDAVGEILESAKEPLNTDAIMAELYHGLSNDAYQRAKSSLSNILSVGKTKGKWKSPTRGMYVGSAFAAKGK